MSEPHKSFFQTFTGVLTAITSLIIAVTGLYAATDGFSFFNKSTSSEKSVLVSTEEDHQKQLDALKRQKVLDDLRIAQEKQKLAAEQELAALRAKNAELKLNADTWADDFKSDNFEDSFVTDEPPRFDVVRDLTGRWNYTNAVGNFVFVLEQNGSELYLQEYDSYGNNVGSGTGSMRGNNVVLNWVEPYMFVMSLAIEAKLSINAQGNMLSGMMYAEGNSMPITLYRQ